MPPTKPHLSGRARKPINPWSSQTGTIYFYMPDVKPFGVFCQWHESSIVVPISSLHSLTSPNTTSTADTVLAGYGESITFTCAEQFYMFCKALYFSDADSRRNILATQDPGSQKSIGKTVHGFSDSLWDTVKSRVCTIGNWYKLTHPSNSHMKSILLGTGDRELAEAASRDRVWGIGFNENKAEGFRGQWGENLLGKCLMRVRDRVRGFEEGREEWEEWEVREGDGDGDGVGERGVGRWGRRGR